MWLPQSMGALEVYQTKVHFLHGWFGCGRLGWEQFLYGPGLSSMSPDRAISPAGHNGDLVAGQPEKTGSSGLPFRGARNVDAICDGWCWCRRHPDRLVGRVIRDSRPRNSGLIHCHSCYSSSALASSVWWVHPSLVHALVLLGCCTCRNHNGHWSGALIQLIPMCCSRIQP